MGVYRSMGIYGPSLPHLRTRLCLLVCFSVHPDRFILRKGVPAADDEGSMEDTCHLTGASG